MKQLFLTDLLLCLYIVLNAQNVQVSVKIFNNRKPVSPYIYGRLETFRRKAILCRLHCRPSQLLL